MPGEQVMLQGRFFTQLRKLGAIGIGSTAIIGLLSTVVYFRRAKAMHIFNTTWSKEDDKKLSERVLKYQGHQKNPDYPRIPFAENRGGLYDELFETYRKAGKYLKLEYMNLKRVDPTIKDTFVKLVLDDLGGDWFDSETEREAAVDRLTKAREALRHSPKGDVAINDAKDLYTEILASKADLVERHSIARSLFDLDG